MRSLNNDLNREVTLTVKYKGKLERKVQGKRGEK